MTAERKKEILIVPALLVVKENLRLFGSLWLGVMIATMPIYMLISLMRFITVESSIPLWALQLSIFLSAVLSVLLIPFMRQTALVKGQWYIYRLGIMLTGIGATLCMTSYTQFHLIIGIILSVGIGPAALITAPWKELEPKVPKNLKEPVYGLFILAFPVGSMLAASVAGFCGSFLSWRISFLVIIALAYFINEITKANDYSEKKYLSYVDEFIRIFFLSSIVVSILYSMSTYFSLLTTLARILLTTLYASVLLFVVLFIFALFFGSKKSSISKIKTSFNDVKEPFFLSRLTMFSIIAFISSGFIFILFYFIQFGWETFFIQTFFMIVPYFLMFSVGILASIILDSPPKRRRNTLISILLVAIGTGGASVAMHYESYQFLLVFLIITGGGMGLSYNQLSKIIYLTHRDVGLAISMQQRVNGTVNSFAIAIIGFFIAAASIIIFQQATGTQLENPKNAYFNIRLNSYETIYGQVGELPEGANTAAARATAIATAALCVLAVVSLFVIYKTEGFQSNTISTKKTI